jgi:hypothetical protein
LFSSVVESSEVLHLWNPTVSKLPCGHTAVQALEDTETLRELCITGLNIRKSDKTHGIQFKHDDGSYLEDLFWRRGKSSFSKCIQNSLEVEEVEEHNWRSLASV